MFTPAERARGRSVGRSAPLTPAHIDALQAGRAAQRARAASASGRSGRAMEASAAIRRAGRSRARELANDAVQSRRRRELIGEPGRGVGVPHERVLICLNAYHKASQLLPLEWEVDDRQRISFAARASDLSEKTARKLVERATTSGSRGTAPATARRRSRSARGSRCAGCCAATAPRASGAACSSTAT